MEGRVKPPYAAPIQGKIPDIAPLPDYVRAALVEYRAEHPDVSRLWIDGVHKVDPDVLDALKYGMGAQQISRQPPPAPKPPTLADFSNVDLIMEMISRGFACMKVPEGGGPPEALRK